VYPEMEPPQPSPPPPFPRVEPPPPDAEPSPPWAPAQPPRFERKPRPEQYPPQFERKPRPPFVPRPVDPVAAVAANATALGLGYMLMRRTRLAAAAMAGTFFLLFALAADPDDLPWRILFGVWWLLMCLHAWYLTRRSEPHPGTRRRDRILAVTAAALVLLTVIGFRWDAWQMVRGAETAHAEGDCVEAAAALDRFDAGHRIAYGGIDDERAAQLAACALLEQARTEGGAAGAATMAEYLDHPAALWDGAGPERAAMLFLAARVGGDPATTLAPGFEQLTETLDTEPGQADAVRSTVEDLMADLDDDTPACNAVAVDDWISAQTWEAPELTEPIAAAAAAVPLHLLACARAEATVDDLTGAQDAYQRFVVDYPDHAEFQAATDELYAVDSEIEFEHVQGLLTADEYCQAPAPWRDAPAYSGRSPHPMWVIGLDPDAYGVSESWTSGTVEETEIVVCVDGPKQGRHLETCYYENDLSSYFPHQVSFYTARFDVKVFALRTGEQVDSYTVHFDGDPCPQTLYYNSYGYTDFGPPGEIEAEVSDKEVRSVFERLQD
jgi:hypothetical protein